MSEQLSECTKCGRYERTGWLTIDKDAQTALCITCQAQLDAKLKAAERATLPLFPGADANEAEVLAAKKAAAFEFLEKHRDVMDAVIGTLMEAPIITEDVVINATTPTIASDTLDVLQALWVRGSVWRRKHPSSEECHWYGLVSTPGRAVRYPKPGDAEEFK